MVLIPKQETSGLRAELDRLEQMAIPFYLTGSRYFGTSTEKSDWDFFTQYCRETCDKLESMGYVSYWGDYHADKHIVHVYKHTSLPIHIQLVKDTRIKNLIQTTMKRCNYFPNKNTTHVWNFAYQLIRGISND